jgi:hypothetical protein
MTIALFVEHYIDTELDLLDNDSAMNAIKKNKNLTSRLLADAKLLLKDGFSENEFKLAFLIVKTAQSRGPLGAYKLSDCCLADTVNITNDIRRTRRFDQVELKTVTKQKSPLCLHRPRRIGINSRLKMATSTQWPKLPFLRGGRG